MNILGRGRGEGGAGRGGGVSWQCCNKLFLFLKNCFFFVETDFLCCRQHYCYNLGVCGMLHVHDICFLVCALYSFSFFSFYQNNSRHQYYFYYLYLQLYLRNHYPLDTVFHNGFWILFQPLIFHYLWLQIFF